MSNLQSITFAPDVLSSKKAKEDGRKAAAETAVTTFGTKAGTKIAADTDATIK